MLPSLLIGSFLHKEQLLHTVRVVFSILPAKERVSLKNRGRIFIPTTTQKTGLPAYPTGSYFHSHYTEDWSAYPTGIVFWVLATNPANKPNGIPICIPSFQGEVSSSKGGDMKLFFHLLEVVDWHCHGHHFCKTHRYVAAPEWGYVFWVGSESFKGIEAHKMGSKSTT